MTDSPENQPTDPGPEPFEPVNAEVPEPVNAEVPEPVNAEVPEPTAEAGAGGGTGEDPLPDERELEERELEEREPEEREPAGKGPRLKQTLALRTPEELRPAIEAILMVVDEPVADNVLAQILERPTSEVTAVLEDLAAEYREQERGFDLRRAAGGWRFYTRSEFAPYVERFVLDGQQARLTQAALETLAVIAYKQPVTRSRISAIRGVAVDGVIRTLLTRGLIEECGAEPDTGAHLYRTTLLFLEKLGLDTLDELPPLAPLLPDLDSLDDVISPSA